MKQFILEVEEGKSKCEKCPFSTRDDFFHICSYLYENSICDKYDFNKINIEEYNERS